MATPVNVSAKEKNHLSARANEFVKKINECMQTRSAKNIKHFWRDNVEAMQTLLDKLDKAELKKEYVMLDRAVHQTLYKSVLINESKRLAREMVNAFAEKAIDPVTIKKFEKRGVKIEIEMKRMGFDREAQVHSALLRLHIKEEKKEIACRVRSKSSRYGLRVFDSSESDSKEPHEPTLDDGLKSKP